MATPNTTPTKTMAYKITRIRSALATLHRTEPDNEFIMNLKVEGQFLVYILTHPSHVLTNNLIRLLSLASHFSELYLRFEGADAAVKQQKERFDMLYWTMVLREACGGDLEADVDLMAAKQVRNFVRGLVDGEWPLVDEAVETGCRF